MDSQPTNQPEFQADSSNFKHRAMPGLLVGLVVLLLLYLLGFGPAFRLSQAGVIPLSAAMTIYRPINRLAESCRPAQGFCVWYLRLWGVNVMADYSVMTR